MEILKRLLCGKTLARVCMTEYSKSVSTTFATDVIQCSKTNSEFDLYLDLYGSLSDKIARRLMMNVTCLSRNDSLKNYVMRTSVCCIMVEKIQDRLCF